MKHKVLIAALATVLSTSAFAWGDREQGALAGIAGLLLLQHASRAQPQPPQPPVQTVPIYSPPVIIETPPSRFIYRPMYRLIDVYIPECNCYRTFKVQIN